MARTSPSTATASQCPALVPAALQPPVAGAGSGSVADSVRADFAANALVWLGLARDDLFTANPLNEL